MSINLIRAAQQTCAYCKGIGHNKFNCPHARDKMVWVKQQIENRMSTGQQNTMLINLQSFLESVPLQDICILLNSILGINDFITLLIQNGSITEEVSRMRYKKDKITVLIWRYLTIYNSVPFAEQRRATKKLNIVTKLEVTTSEFDCPICVDCTPAKEKIVLNCNHCICKTCMDNYLEYQIIHVNFPKPLCPLCRTVITSLSFENINYMTEVSTKYFK
jgi:hypothetical protein